MNMEKSCGYKDLQSVLEAAGAECGAAESHGVLCGIICTGGNSSPEDWLEHLLGVGSITKKSVQTAQDELTRLYSLSLTGLTDAKPGLELLLPDDDTPLAVRSKALGEWCQGFLYGLALGGAGRGTGIPGQVKEIMHDLYQISHAGFVPDADAEAEEFAYQEIGEYVRICVLLCHVELQPLSPPAHRQ